MPSDNSSTDKCMCGHSQKEHVSGCEACFLSDGHQRSMHAFAPEPPPLAPEEEEQAGCAHESWDVTSEWYDHLSMKWHKSRRCNDCGEGLDALFENEPHFRQSKNKGKRPKPPQPLRRPPYTVAYSVGGHLYEIALPGDATVQAADGGLIITHSFAPVAGVVQVRPLEGQQS